MTYNKAVALALLAVAAISASICIEPTKGKLQSLYLSKARIVGRISWYDAVFARETIRSNEPTAKCVRIGKQSINGTNTMFVFTLMTMYELNQDGSGRWHLLHKGSYDE